MDSADIAAAFLQNFRSALQKHLHGKLSTLGAAYVRFLYALQIALAWFVAVVHFGGFPVPAFGADFLAYALLGGICQILFTVFLLWLFSFHNFAVGTTLSKLETVMVAVFGLLLLGDPLTLAVGVAIATSTLGLIVLSAGQTRIGIGGLLRACGGCRHWSAWPAPAGSAPAWCCFARPRCRWPWTDSRRPPRPRCWWC